MERDPDGWIELEHTAMPHWVEGEGPDLVFVHGWPLDSRTWRDVVSELSSDFTCHTFDLPFAGRSRWSEDTPAGPLDFVEATVAALEGMNLGERFGLVGHDSGGSFARMAAARMPERISGIVLGNTEIPNYHSPKMKTFLEMAGARAQHELFRTALGTKAGRAFAFGDCYKDPGLIERELAPRYVTPLLESDRAFTGTMTPVSHLSVEDFDMLSEAHPRITAPVHHVWGGDDPWFPVAQCEGMLPTYAGEATLTVLDGYKLLVHEEAAERFAEEVRALFARGGTTG